MNTSRDATPQRIQLSRTKGWRMPPNTVNVARPGVWGNPFWHAQKFWSLEACLRLYKRMVEGGWSPSNIEGAPGNVGAIAYEAQQEWCKRLRDVKYIRPRYSGEKSFSLWRRVRALAPGTRWRVYQLWCLLQTIENLAIAELESAEARKL